MKVNSGKSSMVFMKKIMKFVMEWLLMEGFKFACGIQNPIFRPASDVKINFKGWKEMDEKVILQKEMDEKLILRKEMDEKFILRKEMDEKVINRTEIDEKVILQKEMDEKVILWKILQYKLMRRWYFNINWWEGDTSMEMDEKVILWKILQYKLMRRWYFERKGMGSW
jgi:hypothetical protein